ncbi:MAG: hypothetical protein IJY03_04510 [Prevotella sp.]|nr:hypothetical protein [Prevotella sp.]
MTNITFNKADGVYVSEAFPGNVNVQVVFPKTGTYPLALETRISSSLPWTKHSTVAARNATNISLPDCAATQQFRIISYATALQASYEAIATPGSSSDAEAIAALNERVADLEEGQEPLVLTTNFDTGYLEQEGVSSGNFGIDYESGYLTFETNE